MAEKLSIQIALEGGAEIERQLADIGEAGQKAFADINKSAEEAGGFKQLDPKDVTAKLQEMGVTGTDSIKKIQDAVQSAGRLEGIVQGVASAENALLALGRAALFIGPALVAGFVALSKAAIASAAEINKVSAEASKLGISVEQFDKFRLAAERAGISQQAISSGLEKVKSDIDKLQLDQVAQNFNELKAAGEGVGAGSKAFRELQVAATQFTPAGEAAAQALQKLGFGIPGTTREDVQQLGTELAKLKGLGFNIQIGQDPINRINAIIDGLAQMPASMERTAIAVKFLGTAFGTQLDQGLKAGTISIDTFKAKVAGVITQEDANKAAALTAALERLSAAWARFSTTGSPTGLITGLNGVATALESVNSVLSKINWGPLTNISFLLNPVGTVIGLIKDQLSDAGQAGAQAGQRIAQGTQQAGQSAQQAQIAFTSWGEAIRMVGGQGAQVGQQAAQGAQQAGQSAQQSVGFWESLGQAVVTTIDFVDRFSSSLGNIVWDAISNVGVAAWNLLSGAIESAIGWLERFLGLQSSVTPLAGGAPIGGAGGGIGSKARGGLLGGRGTGTSDSNLAWVSRGEHIMPARAVRQPGVLAFLESLRRSGGDLRRVLDGMGRFALGGMVPRAIPAFATGGLAGGMSNVTIQFPGLPAIGGLRASSDVVDQLHRAAALAQVRSGGRKPSRYS